VKELLPDLKSRGKVVRGWLGVSVQQLTPDIATAMGLEKSTGALVSDVVEGSPAAKAGMKVGDVILQYNGQEVNHSSDLPILVARTKVGQTVPLKIFRSKQEVGLSVTVEDLKEDEIVAPTSKKSDFGLTVQRVTPEIANKLGLKDIRGVLITAVDPEGRGAEAGLRRGDIILEIDRQPISDPSAYERAVAAAKDNNLLFLVRRGDTNIFVALKPL
jgi:serine protease Do